MNERWADEHVIGRVLAGDADAFAVLVERYQAEMAAFARYMVGGADDAADAVQESFVRAYRSLRRCQDRANFKGWLFRIVSNQCKTQLRRRRRSEPLARGADVAAADDPARDAQQADLRERVHAALQRLPVAQREALVLKYLHGLSIEEMAVQLSTTISALKMRLKRGRERLREVMEEGML